MAFLYEISSTTISDRAERLIKLKFSHVKILIVLNNQDYMRWGWMVGRRLIYSYNLTWKKFKFIEWMKDTMVLLIIRYNKKIFKFFFSFNFNSINWLTFVTFFDEMYIKYNIFNDFQFGRMKKWDFHFDVNISTICWWVYCKKYIFSIVSI